MNNEIKEILDKLNNGKWEKDTEEITYKILFSNEVYKLLDYITNLQQEKDNLYLDNTMLKMEKDIYKQGYEELKELIEKLIKEVNND